jgi:hypothetical protein
MTIPSTSNTTVELSPSVKVLASKETKRMGSVSNIDIIDIRHDAVEVSLKDEILSSLRPETGPKKLPTLLLYDERGLQIFEEVSITAEIGTCL